MSQAYRRSSTSRFDVKAGLLIRQTHHWAADVFVAAIVLHLMRVFFTGAFRKPRELTYYIGLHDARARRCSRATSATRWSTTCSPGMGLAIGYAVALSIPFVGGNLALLIWGGPFPGAHAFESRMYIAPRLHLPGADRDADRRCTSLLVALAPPHAVPRRARATERTRRRRADVPGPGAALARAAVRRRRACCSCSAGSSRSTRSGCGGRTTSPTATNGAQPDWYLGWLIGALRLVPGFDVTIGELHARAEPVLGRRAVPARRVRVLFLWPWLERRLTGDHRFHNLLDRPRDEPRRTAFGAAFFTWVFVIFVAGSADRVYVTFGIPYERGSGSSACSPSSCRWSPRRDEARLRRAPARRRDEGAAARCAGPQPLTYLPVVSQPRGAR